MNIFSLAYVKIHVALYSQQPSSGKFWVSTWCAQIPNDKNNMAVLRKDSSQAVGGDIQVGEVLCKFLEACYVTVYQMSEQPFKSHAIRWRQPTEY